MKAYSSQLDWTVASEDIPLQTGTADRVTISFGLRNVTNRKTVLSEAIRVLKPGGRFCCLEFSTVQNMAFPNSMISGHLMFCHSWAEWLHVTKLPTFILPNQFVHFPNSMNLPE